MYSQIYIEKSQLDRATSIDQVRDSAREKTRKQILELLYDFIYKIKS